jgi:predicted dehydrogenase
VLSSGLGNMGMSPRAGPSRPPGAEIVGLVNRSPRRPARRTGRYPRFDSFEAGMEKPDLVVIATYSDSHADLAIAAMEAGAHVFVEKPLATTSPMPSAWSPPRRD